VKRSTGVRAGWDNGTVKRRKSGVPTRLAVAEGHTTKVVQNARLRSTPRGRRPQHARNPSAREPGDPSTAHARWRRGPHREGRRSEADDGRPSGVGQARSTDEVAEQCRASGGVGDGGKGPGQGAHEPAKRVPYAVPDKRAECAGPCATSSDERQGGEVHRRSSTTSRQTVCARHSGK
jgi:hypothetical protein